VIFAGSNNFVSGAAVAGDDVDLTLVYPRRQVLGRLGKFDELR